MPAVILKIQRLSTTEHLHHLSSLNTVRRKDIRNRLKANRAGFGGPCWCAAVEG